jgi:peptidoglycan/xylan/chitin deacetylase (PgdA/CDA1 family)
MNWDEVEALCKEGHDIGYHSMNHVHLGNLSKKEIEYQVGQSKKCLQDHGIEVTSFGYPFNDGSSDKKITKIVSKYYDLARTANSPISYLQCGGLDNQSTQTYCRTDKDGLHLDSANVLTISGWSHDFSRMVNSYSNSGLFERFIQVLNSQDKYDTDGTINAFPIVICYRIGEPSTLDYNTDMDLFDKEMKYLHDNGFRVLTMSDLYHDNNSNYICIKQIEGPMESGKIASVD